MFPFYTPWRHQRVISFFIHKILEFYEREQDLLIKLDISNIHGHAIL